MAENLGDGSVFGELAPVRVGVVLPAGLRAVGIAGSSPDGGVINTALAMSCARVSLSCTFEGLLAPFESLEVRVRVEVLEGAVSSETVLGTVSGGGAASVSVGHHVVVGEGATGFGLEEFGLDAEEEGGGFQLQAGSHPFQVTGTFDFNEGPDTAGGEEADPAETPTHKPEVEVAALPKDIITRLPAGLIGSATAIPQCSLADFLKVVDGQENACPADTAIGVASATIHEPENIGTATFTEPVFNLEPYAGEPARFGFFIPLAVLPVVLDTALRDGPGEDYGVNVIASDTSETAGALSARVTFWGVPGDPRHDSSRGWGCLYESLGLGSHAPCQSPEMVRPPAFLTMPTSCTGPLSASVEMDSWAEPGRLLPFSASEALQALDGCGSLRFAPVFEAEPTTSFASSPSGLNVNIDFKDEGLTNASGVAESQLKATSVILPEGLTVNPSSGVGLGGCTTADYQKETVESPPGAGCPEDSKLGTVEVQTPLLSTPVHGSVYIAEPYENPFSEPGHPAGSLLAMYVVLKSPETGVLIKLAGKIEAGGQPGVSGLAPGQLRTTFENNPQLAFDHFNFHFREGQQAPLITPEGCSSYETQALLTPWADPTAVLADASSFTITRGLEGGACPSGGRFSPQIQAGTVNNDAGSYSAFQVHLTRTDADQEISQFTTDLPNGLTGNLTGIPYCSEESIQQARSMTGSQEQADPSCPAASELGNTLVGTGAGAVLAYTPGKIYMAGPYNGDPFSLVSITSAVVGPFDLGTVVIRFGLRIDPRTAQVSVDPDASEPIPTIIDGIVTHVRDIRVYITRPGFVLNATTCDPLAISSTLTSSQGMTATISSRYQTAACQTLKFTPTMTATATGHNSKLDGAALKFKIAYPPHPIGSQAWFEEVKVELPKQLPARLETLQRACLSTVFEHNPAACPPAATIGHAIVHTPILPVPLTGPVYFVSYGGAKFPEAVIVLQGDNVTVDLHGETYISHQNITSATFRNTPDVPFENIEVTLPQGRYSEFGVNLQPQGNYNLCGHKLTIPTLLKAQNATQKTQNTPITIQNCKPKPHKHHTKHHTTHK
jgi:hypothetical protein